MDGTRAFIIGRRHPVVIDPGPDDADQIGRLVEELHDAKSVRILLTHGHADHTGAASALAAATDATVYGPSHPEATTLSDGALVETDAGSLETVFTPGHTQDHVCYWWSAERTLFAGDLLLGSGNTTWVAGYPECVSDYLASLDRIEELEPRLILPAHGPALTDPPADIHRFRQHRMERIEQVRTALAEHPTAAAADLVTPVYGHELPSAVRGYAEQSIEAILDHLR